MSDEVLYRALLADLEALHVGGCRSEQLETCESLAKLSLVEAGVAADGRAALIIRGLLEVVAAEAAPEQATETAPSQPKSGESGAKDTRSDRQPGSDTDVLIGAALIGIHPRDTSTGVKGSKSDRQENAGDVPGSPGPTAFRRPAGRRPYLGALADAILRFDRTAPSDPKRMRAFELAAALPTATLPAVFPSGGSADVSTPGPSDPTVARPIRLSDAVRRALEVVRSECVARGRAVYTLDVLRAIMDMPGGRVGLCLDEVLSGHADKIRRWLAAAVVDLNAVAEPYVAIDWDKRIEIQRAHELARADGTGSVTDLHHFLAIMDGDSGTKEELAKQLGGPYFKSLRALVDERRRIQPSAKRTPLGPPRLPGKSRPQ